MALQFKDGPFAGSYTTNTFAPGRAQSMPGPSLGTPYGGPASSPSVPRQPGPPANMSRSPPASPGRAPMPFAGAMQPNPAYRPAASAYQPLQGPFISTTYAHPGGGWGHSPQPPVQPGPYQPRVSRSAYRPASAGMRFGRG